MIIPMLCVTIFVILVVWFLLPRVARLMIHTPTAISIFVCVSMVQLIAVFISMRCNLCGHFLHVALTLILVVGYAIAASEIACKIRCLMVTVCPSQFATHIPSFPTRRSSDLFLRVFPRQATSGAERWSLLSTVGTATRA